jgi:signal transduction histidine kinase
MSENASIKEIVAAHSKALRHKLRNSFEPLEAAQIIERAEEFLAESLAAFDTQELLRNSRAKDEFMSAISHELRTPLTALLGMSELLRRGVLDPERSRRAIETIYRASENEARIVEDFLEISRIMTGRLKLDPGKIDLAGIFDAAVKSVRPIAERKQLALEAIVDQAPVPIYADARRLTRVLWHLLNNAIKFTPEGGRIVAQLSVNGDEAEISVKDSGIGITAEHLPQIFKRFLQMDPVTKARFGGLGAGLVIARHLVEQHAGSIRAESPGEGQGSTFTVTLPLKMD